MFLMSSFLCSNSKDLDVSVCFCAGDDVEFVLPVMVSVIGEERHVIQLLQLQVSSLVLDGDRVEASAWDAFPLGVHRDVVRTILDGCVLGDRQCG